MILLSIHILCGAIQSLFLKDSFNITSNSRIGSPISAHKKRRPKASMIFFNGMDFGKF